MAKAMLSDGDRVRVSIPKDTREVKIMMFMRDYDKTIQTIDKVIQNGSKGYSTLEGISTVRGVPIAFDNKWLKKLEA